MNNIVFSILLILIGLFVGIIFMIILNSIKLMNASKKVQSLLDNAKKEADKLKRDSILEAKEENHRLKIELDKEKRQEERKQCESEIASLKTRIKWLEENINLSTQQDKEADARLKVKKDEVQQQIENFVGARIFE